MNRSIRFVVVGRSSFRASNVSSMVASPFVCYLLCCRVNLCCLLSMLMLHDVGEECLCVRTGLDLPLI